ncbi:MAG: hypothetical protein IJ491_00960 [Clostridia bacterium]|nr:hypothetical protein [Clostridia bacterium]
MKNERTVLVCVTAQESSQTLVRAGKAIAERNKASLEVVSVLPVMNSDGRVNPQMIEKLYRTAQKEGGEMAFYFSDEPILTVSAHIAKRKPLTVVVGFPGEESNDFVFTLHLLLPEIPISMVGKDGTIYNMLPYEAVQSVGTK